MARLKKRGLSITRTKLKTKKKKGRLVTVTKGTPASIAAFKSLFRRKK